MVNKKVRGLNPVLSIGTEKVLFLRCHMTWLYQLRTD